MSGASHDRSRPGHISRAARKRGAQVRAQRGIFNRYIRALEGPRAVRIRDRITEIDATLERGTRRKKAPVFEAGQRVGSTERWLPLLPSEKALLMAERARLVRSLAGHAPPAELRAAFLEILPQFADRNELTREILLAVGVPATDLDEVGLIDTGPDAK